MTKLLNGSELASFIKVRQAKQVRRLRQSDKIIPKLVIIKSQNADEVINTYVRMKQRYAEDILVDVEVVTCQQAEMIDRIEQANSDGTVHGIVVQLPLDDKSATEEVVSHIAPAKDVDGLGQQAAYISATAEAIDWLLSGFGVDLRDKTITLLGRGKLVGAPLEKLWGGQGHKVQTISLSTENPSELLQKSDVIVSATGQAYILKSSDVPQKAVVVDAGTVSEDGKIVGDIDPELYNRKDLTITPQKGGVGPLTIVLMFDHVIQAANAIATQDD